MDQSMKHIVSRTEAAPHHVQFVFMCFVVVYLCSFVIVVSLSCVAVVVVLFDVCVCACVCLFVFFVTVCVSCFGLCGVCWLYLVCWSCALLCF